MRRRTFIQLAVLLPFGALGRRRVLAADEPAFKVIVHPDNPITDVDRELLRDAFLRRATEWRNGDTIRPIDLSRRFHVRDRFTREVLKKTPAQLRSYWTQQIFSGKGVPPPEADAVRDLIGYVLDHRGAVGYLPASADTEGAKVVRID
jgi:ABC-type phosphate transport system substrate-binding protein